MAVLTLTRFINVRNATNFNNLGVVGNALNIIQHSDVIFKSYSTDTDHEIISPISTNQPAKKMTKAMKLYFQRFVDHKKFMNEEIAKYNIGKRQLANIMGKDVNNFTEGDVADAINYLFPSGLYNIAARPMMRNPEKITIKRKEAEFDESGRPHHFLFYTTKPNYYEILHNMTASLNNLNKMEDEKIKLNLPFSRVEKLDLSESTWISKTKLENIIFEELSDTDYKYFITSMDRLATHSLSKYAESLIMKYRKILTVVDEFANIPKLQYDSEKTPFIFIERCARKSSIAQVKVIGNGSGNIVINGQDITYFKDMQSREQIIFPLLFTDMYDKVNIEATVSGGGSTGQAGAIRWGISQGLRSFVDIKMVEKMRLAGLLTNDWRRRERKKWGQEGARKKFTWKKR